MVLQVRYNSWQFLLSSCAKQRRKMTKFCVAERELQRLIYLNLALCSISVFEQGTYLRLHKVS